MKKLVAKVQTVPGQSPMTVLAVSLMAIGFLVLVSSQWRSKQKVRDVQVTGISLLDKKEILDLANIQTDSLRLASLNLHEVRARIESHPFVKEASVTLSGAETILISIQERVPVAFIPTSKGVSFVDSEGHVLDYRFSSQGIDVPMLTGFYGQSLDTVHLYQALAIIHTLEQTDRKLYKNISEIVLGKDGCFTLRTTDGAIPVLFGCAENIDMKVNNLLAYWTAETLRGEIPDLSYIDLRWQGQVVVRMKKMS